MSDKKTLELTKIPKKNISPKLERRSVRGVGSVRVEQRGGRQFVADSKPSHLKNSDLTSVERVARDSALRNSVASRIEREAKRKLSAVAESNNKPAAARPTEQKNDRKRGGIRRSGPVPHGDKKSGDSDDGNKDKNITRSKNKRGGSRISRKFRAKRKDVVRNVSISESIGIKDLAHQVGKTEVELSKMIIAHGLDVPSDGIIDGDFAVLMVEEMGHNVVRSSHIPDVVRDFMEMLNDEDGGDERDPVVVVVGHVDHGKTTILDAMRNSKLCGGESGGITQHIGAYRAAGFTMIDTPGHALFKDMRSKGIQVTDIVLLIVAADSGVQEQTIESIKQSEGMPIIVVITKTDLPGADPDMVRRKLLEHSIAVESMGGDCISVEVSAQTGAGMDDLRDAISTQASILELKARTEGPASAVVIDSWVEQGFGPVASVIVRKGTLHIGDVVVGGSIVGRVRAMRDEHGSRVKEAGPSTPVVVMGLEGVLNAGDDMAVVEKDSIAREISAYYKKPRSSSTSSRAEDVKELSWLVRADTYGTCAAVRKIIEDSAIEGVNTIVAKCEAGDITIADIDFALERGARIAAFRVKVSPKVRSYAAKNGIAMDVGNVIYMVEDLIGEVIADAAIKEAEERVIGTGEVIKIFQIGKLGQVIGCRVDSGKFVKGNKMRITRGDDVLISCSINSMKRYTDYVDEAVPGHEFGVPINGDIMVGDLLVCLE